MARRVQHPRSDIAERKHLFVARSPERKRDFRARPEHILCADCLGELPTCREMVGMNVRVDHEVDAHAGSLRGTQIRLDLADGIDDGTGGPSAAAE
jgi:hypothetical protein